MMHISVTDYTRLYIARCAVWHQGHDYKFVAHITPSDSISDRIEWADDPPGKLKEREEDILEEVSEIISEEEFRR